MMESKAYFCILKLFLLERSSFRGSNLIFVDSSGSVGRDSTDFESGCCSSSSLYSSLIMSMRSFFSLLKFSGVSSMTFLLLLYFSRMGDSGLSGSSILS